MAIYKTCPYCGANLDPGEKCDCIEAMKEQIKDGLIKMSTEQLELLWSAMVLSDETGKSLEECYEYVK